MSPRSRGGRSATIRPTPIAMPAPRATGSAEAGVEDHGAGVSDGVGAWGSGCRRAPPWPLPRGRCLGRPGRPDRRRLWRGFVGFGFGAHVPKSGPPQPDRCQK